MKFNLLMLLGLVMLAGCAGDKQQVSASTAEPQITKQDEEFAAGASRQPTPRTLHATADILVARGRDAEALALLKQAIIKHPRYMPAYTAMSQIYTRLGRIDDAIATLSTARDVDANDHVVLNNLGMCYCLKNDYRTAVAVFTRATTLAPQQSLYRANLAMAIGMLGRYDESLSLYEQVVPVADAHHNVGVLAQARQDKHRANAEFTIAAALSAKPTTKPAK